MGDTDRASEIVGRGVREGGRLFREWFTTLSSAPERNEKTAYVFVMGSFVDLLRTFDFQISFPEITALQTAVRRVAGDYLNLAEDYGYSPDICGYVKADVGMHLRDGEHPMGRIPKPSFVLAINSCNTYIKWAEIWERMFRVPLFTMDIPSSRSGENDGGIERADLENDRRYVTYQVKELIALCERISGKKFDIDRLRECMGYSNRMSAAYKRLIELNRSVPAPFNALNEGTVYLGVANAARGTEAGAQYFERALDEMTYKVSHGIGSLPEEKYRLIFIGVPCYPIFRRFQELFTAWGGVYVFSTYLWFASGGLNVGFQYDLANPVESLAEGIWRSVRNAQDGMFFMEHESARLSESFKADGLVFHAVKSCRTVSTSLADKRRVAIEEAGIPSLFIESDLVDKRVVSEAQLKNRIDAFFEGLQSRQLRSVTTSSNRGCC
jgi:benzoyl-CoA reductase subunit B